MLALLTRSPLLGDVKLPGKRSGSLIGALITLVVRLLLESCGMMWNQPTVATLSPACCAMAPADAQATTNATVSFFMMLPSCCYERGADRRCVMATAPRGV